MSRLVGGQLLSTSTNPSSSSELKMSDRRYLLSSSCASSGCTSSDFHFLSFSFSRGTTSSCRKSMISAQTGRGGQTRCRTDFRFHDFMIVIPDLRRINWSSWELWKLSVCGSLSEHTLRSRCWKKQSLASTVKPLLQLSGALGLLVLQWNSWLHWRGWRGIRLKPCPWSDPGSDPDCSF